ncbi:hypothetical protein LNQ52_02825 [Klebsiella pneumoniae subsp. pneumoniae]|nr:hypothetical protein [Klebsiella pneumoniae subsp. pneumoniae]
MPSIAVYIKKEDIIDFVWKNRAGCVSESSYYKLINQMRNNFSLVGLKADDIVTRPRIGVSLSLPLEPFKKQRSEAGEQASDTARGKDSRQTHLAEGKKIYRQNTSSGADNVVDAVNGYSDAISTCTCAK